MAGDVFADITGAICQAIASTAAAGIMPQLDAPATPEKVLLSIKALQGSMPAWALQLADVLGREHCVLVTMDLIIGSAPREVVGIVPTGNPAEPQGKPPNGNRARANSHA